MGSTALMNAAEHNPNPDVVGILLLHGADVQAKNLRRGWTALMLCGPKNQESSSGHGLAEGWCGRQSEEWRISNWQSITDAKTRPIKGTDAYQLLEAKTK